MNMATTTSEEKYYRKKSKPVSGLPASAPSQSDRRLSDQEMQVILEWLTDRCATKGLAARLGSTSLTNAIYKAGVGARQAVREGLLTA